MQRLKTRPQFQAVLGGTVLAKTSHFALHRLELDAVVSGITMLFPSCASWVGAMVPKRWAKRAVTRNAVKRQIYILSASLTSIATSGAFLIRLRREFSRKEFASASSVALKEAVRKELLELVHNGLAASLSGAAKA